MASGQDQTDDIAASWVANADAWTATIRAGGIASRRLATDRAVVGAVLAQAPRRVLDLGCGEGWLARTLAAGGIEVVGTDASAPLVEAARAAGGGTFHVLGYEDLTADPAQAGRGFDVIVANFALLDQELAPLLHGLGGILAPDGALVIQTVHPLTAGPPYADGWRTEDFRGFAAAGAWHPMRWYFRTLASWFALFREAGYVLGDLAEPAHPETGAPLSLLMVGKSDVARS